MTTPTNPNERIAEHNTTCTWCVFPKPGESAECGKPALYRHAKYHPYFYCEEHKVQDAQLLIDTITL